MAFLIHSVEHGRVPAFEYLPCSAITPKVGMALVQSGGNLALASGATKPAYISMIEKETACAAGDIIPVIRVDEGIVFETESSAAFTNIKLGNKVTLASDGLRVTATTTDGMAEVVHIEDTASGGMVRVRF